MSVPKHLALVFHCVMISLNAHAGIDVTVDCVLTCLY